MMINLRNNLLLSSSHPTLHILWIILIIQELLLFLQPWMTTTTAHGFKPWKRLYVQKWRSVPLMVLSRNNLAILQAFPAGRKLTPLSWHVLSMRPISICMEAFLTHQLLVTFGSTLKNDLLRSTHHTFINYGAPYAFCREILTWV